MQRVVLIGVAGALGALARYSLAELVQRSTQGGFPWGTMAVNILGSFLFGMIWTLAEDRLVISTESRLIILTGFMGAFTTFSTFIFETGGLLWASQWMLAVGNLLGQIVVGLAFLALGMAAGRLF